jgi:hypothetical protein
VALTKSGLALASLGGAHGLPEDDKNSHRTSYFNPYTHAGPTSTPHLKYLRISTSTPRLLGSAIMADLPPPKPDPTAEQATAPGAVKVPEETATATVTSEATQEKPAAAASTVAETVTNAAATATSAVKDNVFSMFGGGPKKEKREEVDDADEPSGGSKGKAAEVRQVLLSSDY